MKPRRLVLLLVVSFSGLFLMSNCGSKGQLCRQKIAALEGEIASLQRELRSEREIKQQIVAVTDGLREENESLKREIETYRAELVTPSVVSIRECEAKLKGCQALKSEAEKKAYAMGMLDVWQSISVSAVPESSGWLMKDYYLSFSITLRNRTVFTFKVQTSGPESGFSKHFSRMADAASILAIMVPK